MQQRDGERGRAELRKKLDQLAACEPFPDALTRALRDPQARRARALEGVRIVHRNETFHPSGALKGTFFLTQKLLPLLSDGGSILNISTGLTRFTFPGRAAYAAMKGGVEVLTRYLAKELGPRGISVNTLAPGAIATDFGGGVVRDNEAMNKGIASQTALGRVGLPDDIGAAVSMLLSPESKWMTGQRIEASGGMFL